MYLLAFRSRGLATGKARVLARAEWVGEKMTFLNILPGKRS
jgi:hypothetical protein